jgi:hypothetical protein
MAITAKEYERLAAAPPVWADLGLAFEWIKRRSLFGLGRTAPPSSQDVSRFVEAARQFPVYGRPGLGSPTTVDPRRGHAFARYGDLGPVPFEVIAAAHHHGVLGCDIEGSRLFRAPTTEHSSGAGQSNGDPQVWEYIGVCAASIDIVSSFLGESTESEKFRLPTPVSPASASAIGTERLMLELVYRLGLDAAALRELKLRDLQPPEKGGDGLPVFTYRLTVRSSGCAPAIALPTSWNGELAALLAGRSPHDAIFPSCTPSKLLATFNRAAKRSKLDPISRHWGLVKAGFRARTFGRRRAAGEPDLRERSGKHMTQPLRILDQIREKIDATPPDGRRWWTRDAIEAEAMRIDPSVSKNERWAIATVLLSDVARRR